MTISESVDIIQARVHVAAELQKRSAAKQSQDMFLRREAVRLRSAADPGQESPTHGDQEARRMQHEAPANISTSTCGPSVGPPSLTLPFQVIAAATADPPDPTALFQSLFSAESLKAAFASEFKTTTGKGVDRLNGYQFSSQSDLSLTSAASKCLAGRLRFSPFLEVLKVKGRGKPPRLIGIPTVRDRVILHQLNQYLALLYPDRVPRNVASKYVRDIATDIKSCPAATTWVCSTDIETFYDAIERDRLLKVLAKRVTCAPALRLIEHALVTPTIPKSAPRSKHKDYRTQTGVPQGLAISNILASIYLEDVDEEMPKLGVKYYRYVDDVLMYGDEAAVKKAYVSLKSRLQTRGLSLHGLKSGKTRIEPLAKPFAYLGYTFYWPEITVRDSTIERFLQSIASKFSEYAHNKERRKEKHKYLTDDRLKSIFMLELNERITGAISEKKRYGWIAYFNQITDLKLLHQLDAAIAGMFTRLKDFGGTAPADLRKLRRAYYEMKFNPTGGYVRDYDKFTTTAEMLKLLVDRGRVGPGDAPLSEAEVEERFERYRSYVLSAMHKDEGRTY